MKLDIVVAYIYIYKYIHLYECKEVTVKKDTTIYVLKYRYTYIYIKFHYINKK